MKTKIFKNWATTLVGLIITLIAADGYFMITGYVREMDLVSFISVGAFGLIIMLSSHRGLLDFIKDVVFTNKSK